MSATLADNIGSADMMDFDPFGSEFRSNPEAFEPRLLKASPGFIEMDGVPSAFVATYAQNTAILRNFKTFSSLKPQGLPGMERVDFFNSMPVMNYSDPPDHTRRRKLVNPAFTPKRVEMLNEKAGLLIDELLDRLIDKGGEFEVMDELTKPLAIETLLGRFMGIAAEDHHIFMNYVATLPLLDKMRPGDSKPQAYLDAWAAGAAYCRGQQELARRGECQNLVGVIVDGADGGAITDDEMMAMMIVLLTGGFSTVAGAAGAALLNLARNPDVAERIRHDPSLASAHLEESLRLDPPVSLVMRFAKEAAEVDGVTIPAGMPLYVMLRVACHDPAVFPDPYRFDIDRPNVKDHIAFGQGMHTCIGNAITRSIVPLLTAKAAERLPTLRLSERYDAVIWDASTPRARHISQLYLKI